MESKNESDTVPVRGKETSWKVTEQVTEGRNVMPPVPYYRVDDSSVRDMYRAKSYDLLQALTNGRPSIAGSAFIIGLCKSFAEAVVLPQNPTPTRQELKALEEEVAPGIDTAPLLDGTLRRMEQYQMFAETTATWRTFGVGDIRSLYLFAVLASDDETEDPLRIGGFPPTPHTVIGVRRLVGHSNHCIGARASEWLAYDAYLGDGLKHLGVKWLDVEDAVTAAFFNALPKQYRALLDDQEAPRPLSFLLWRHDFERWQAVHRYAARILKAEMALTAALQPLPYAPLLGSGIEDIPAMLTRLRQVVTVPEWVDDAKWRLADFKKVNPPTVRPVYRAIADTLAKKIGGLSRAESPPDDAPLFARRLFASMAGSGGDSGRQSRDFLCLVADILFHLAVARGYPTAYHPNGALQIPTFHDWNSIRYLLAEQK